MSAKAVPSHLQAIVTTYHPPTNTRGARVSAKCDAGSVSVPWSYELAQGEEHARAAEALCRKLGWNGALRGGAVGRGYVWVFIDSTSRDPRRRYRR